MFAGSVLHPINRFLLTVFSSSWPVLRTLATLSIHHNCPFFWFHFVAKGDQRQSVNQSTPVNTAPVHKPSKGLPWSRPTSTHCGVIGGSPLVATVSGLLKHKKTRADLLGNDEINETQSSLLAMLCYANPKFRRTTHRSNQTAYVCVNIEETFIEH